MHESQAADCLSRPQLKYQREGNRKRPLIECLCECVLCVFYFKVNQAEYNIAQMGRKGGKQEAKLSLMFRYCCYFPYLGKHQCWEGNIQLKNSDPLQAAGVNTKKEDSETVFLAKRNKFR